jgi:hypothetical protein
MSKQLHVEDFSPDFRRAIRVFGFQLKSVYNLDCHLVFDELVFAQLDFSEGPLAKSFSKNVVSDFVATQRGQTRGEWGGASFLV